MRVHPKNVSSVTQFTVHRCLYYAHTRARARLGFSKAQKTLGFLDAYARTHTPACMNVE